MTLSFEEIITYAVVLLAGGLLGFSASQGWFVRKKKLASSSFPISLENVHIFKNVTFPPVNHPGWQLDKNGNLKLGEITLTKDADGKAAVSLGGGWHYMGNRVNDYVDAVVCTYFTRKSAEAVKSAEVAERRAEVIALDGGKKDD